MTYQSATQRIAATIIKESKGRSFDNPTISLFSVDSMGNYGLELVSQSPTEIARLFLWNVHQLKHAGQEIRVNGYRVNLTN